MKMSEAAREDRVSFLMRTVQLHTGPFVPGVQACHEFCAMLSRTHPVPVPVPGQGEGLCSEGSSHRSEQSLW